MHTVVRMQEPFNTKHNRLSNRQFEKHDCLKATINNASVS